MDLLHQHPHRPLTRLHLPRGSLFQNPGSSFIHHTCFTLFHLINPVTPLPLPYHQPPSTIQNFITPKIASHPPQSHPHSPNSPTTPTTPTTLTTLSTAINSTPNHHSHQIHPQPLQPPWPQPPQPPWPQPPQPPWPHLVGHGKCGSNSKDVVSINSCLVVEVVPDEGGQVEEEGLCCEYFFLLFK